jgi:F420-dependent oxidoreductase-like protein
MRIGVMIGADGSNAGLRELVDQARKMEALGLDNLWMANIFSFDAISTLGVIGWETQKIRLGTAVTPTYPRHPTAIAQQALTTAAAANNRFSLGIGLSHKLVIEGMLGMSYDKPAAHMREYLSVLAPLLRGEAVSFNGNEFRVNGVSIDVPGTTRVPLLVAALGPAMLKLTGELADGTITWMVGPKTMEQHVVKSITAAANAARRPPPTVVGGFPVVLTNKPAEARAEIARNLTVYGQLPSYRAMLDREGAAGPADVALAGDENYMRSAVMRLRDIGVTDFTAAIMATEPETYRRTLEFLADLK